MQVLEKKEINGEHGSINPVAGANVEPCIGGSSILLIFVAL
jgi:hypothetical protein